MSNDSDLIKRFDELAGRLDSLVVQSGVGGCTCGERAIELAELAVLVWRVKWIILSVTLLITMCSVIYAKSLPNVYRSEALLVPVDEDSGGRLSGPLSQLGGVAALAGINLGGGGGGGGKATLAIEVLASRDFIFRFISKHEILVPLMASKSWDREADELIIDPSIYDSLQELWVREVPYPKNSKPSLQEAYNVITKLLSVSRDKETGYVKVAIKHVSPKISKQWVDWIVADINNELRVRDVFYAEKTIKFLNERMSSQSIAEMKNIFHQLIEEQMKIVILAEVADEYVFRVIDPAIVPEKKYSPSRAMIVTLSCFFGGLASVFIALLYGLACRNFII